jgi:hypothetical protein
MTRGLMINRAPVLTLWAAVVAERLGYDRGAAATFGRTVAGVTARAKAVWLGIEKPSPKQAAKRRAKSPKPAGRLVEVHLLGRTFAAVETPKGLRALSHGKPIDPASVQRYLTDKFGDDLEDVRAAMKALARSLPKERLAAEAYALYEAFRPTVPRQKKGWGAEGVLDLDLIRSLAER